MSDQNKIEDLLGLYCLYEDIKEKMNSYNSVTGEIVRSIRTEAKMSLRKLASMMNISPAYLHDLEVGKRKWNYSLLEKVSKILCKTQV